MIYQTLTIALIFACVGCQTTGDPKAGGLLGWSEVDAKKRQQELQVRAQKVREQAKRDVQRNQQLEQEANQTQAEADHLRARLNQHIRDAKELARKVEQLKQTHALKQGDLQNLRRRYQQLQFSDQQFVQQYSQLDSYNERVNFVEVIAKQNNQLSKEITLLLGL